VSFEAALRATEILLALALIQASAEHLLTDPRDRGLFALRIALLLMLLSGLALAVVLPVLLVISARLLVRFDGPYNGGADRMGVLVLACLTLARLAPSRDLAELALAYLGAQLVLSYLVSGWVKIVEPGWRRGTALADVFRFSAYPVSEKLRGLAGRPLLLGTAGWAVMALELGFPLALASRTALIAALALAGLFHLANACLFGLNRFLWAWLAAYPSVLWLQGRLFPP